MRIRILDRMVAATFLKLFLIFLAAAPPLFIIGDVAEHLDDYLDQGLTSLEVAKAYLFQLPLFIQFSFPIAALIATVFTVYNMTTHREVVAAKAGGISFHRLVRPTLAVGLLLMGVALWLNDIVPRANRIAGTILRNEDPNRSWKADFVYESDSGLKWQIGRLTAGTGRMNDVRIVRPATDSTPALDIQAAAAGWDSIAGWKLEHGFLRTILPDSTQRTREFDGLRIPSITEAPQDFLKSPRKPEEMTWAEIDHDVGILRRTGGNARLLLVKQAQKLSIPVATLVVILFGGPMATSSRRGGAAYGVGVALGTLMVYILLLRILQALGAAGTIPPAAAAWLPNAAFATVAVVLLWRVRT